MISQHGIVQIDCSFPYRLFFVERVKKVFQRDDKPCQKNLSADNLTKILHWICCELINCRLQSRNQLYANKHKWQNRVISKVHDSQIYREIARKKQHQEKVTSRKVFKKSLWWKLLEKQYSWHFLQNDNKTIILT